MKHILLTSYPDAELAARWNAFAERAPFATHYVTPNYFTDPYIRGQRFAVLTIDGDEITAAMTGVVDENKIDVGHIFAAAVGFWRRGRSRERGKGSAGRN